MAERKETYIGNSKLKGSPEKFLKVVLGEQVVKSKNIANKAVTSEKLADGIVLPTKADIIYLRWWDNESLDSHKEEANPGDYFYKADTDSLYVAKEIEESIEWERKNIKENVFYIKKEGDQFGIGKIKEQWGTLLKLSSSDIKDLIPTEASSTNKLADKNYVNNGIATATAEFKGTFNSLEELQQVTDANANDYGFVIATDSAGNTIYKRYKYVEGTGWQWEYDINNSNFTTDQWAAINSAITTELVTKLNNLPSSTEIGALSSLETSIKTSIIDAINEVNTIAKNDINKIVIKFGYHDAILQLYSEFIEQELDSDDYIAYWQGTLNNINYILYARTLAGSNVPPKDSILLVTATNNTTFLQVVNIGANSTAEELYNEIYSE